MLGSLNKGHLYWHTGGHRYALHRLAFLYMEGKLPKDQVDHINRIRDDNRWCNLRHADYAINASNRSLAKNNTLGVRGVTTRGKKFEVRFKGGYYGVHDSLELAELVSQSVRERFYGSP